MTDATFAFSNLTVGGVFRFLKKPGLYRKTRLRHYVEDGVPEPVERPVRGNPRVRVYHKPPLPDLDTLDRAWGDGHEQWVAEMVVERAETWQAVLVGVKITVEYGEGAGRMLADI